MPVLDLIVRAGLVVTPTTSPFTADIAVQNGKITEIGRVRQRAHRVIDADGAIVIPGLCALEPPADVARFDRNRQRHLAPGVTTTIEVVGGAAAPPSKLGELTAGLGSSLTDRSFVVSHDALRREVMGNKVRDMLVASDGDVEAMASTHAAALQAGVAGIESTGHSDLAPVLAASAQMFAIQHEAEAELRALLNLSPELETDELIDAGRRLLDEVEMTCVVVACRERLDDGDIVSAVRPPDDGSGFDGPNTIVGAGLNPLALVAAVVPGQFDYTSAAASWAETATAFGLADRGRIDPDLRADINVIDGLSSDLETGIVSTIVAGTEIVSFDELTGQAPGRFTAALTAS